MRQKLTGNTTSKAFTIVELLIVIVVIGILAAIVIVAYNGIQSRARTAGLQADMNAAVKIVENARTTSGGVLYAFDQTAAQTAGLDPSVTYINSATLGGFCVTKTVLGITYMATSSNKAPHSGPGCTLVNYITNPTFEAGTTIGWSTGVNGTISATTANGAATGTYATLVTHANATAGNAYIADPIPTTVGKQYSITYAVKNVSGSPILSTSIRNGTIAGSVPADSTVQSITPSTSFTRYTSTFTAENATTYFMIDITGTTSGQSFALDSVMATEGVNAIAYIDPLTNPAAWSWATANNSTSTGPAF